ncbi:MAG: aminopeptidase P family protein, partial [Gemmatimonadota bacterium]|nr:aminopeptidase P family protein [Gemmatimonadota bacterium]
PGDLLHVDYGVRLMGLVTDQQKMGYVLEPGETAPPAGLQELFAQSVRTGEILAEELVPGVEGRTVRLRALARTEQEGIQASIYSHVQGNWVHGVGAWAIQDWPERYGVHPREPVRESEFWSVEYSVSGDVPGWGAARMAREEDAWINPATGRLEFLVGPQRELWLIRTPSRPVS